MFKKYSIRNRVWRTVFEIALGTFVTILMVVIMSLSFLKLNIVTSHNVGERYRTEDKKTVKQLTNYMKSLGLDYVIFDKETNKIMEGKYLSKEISLFKKVVEEKSNLTLNSVHYDLYTNNNYYVVIRYNEIPEFSNHYFRNISYNMLTFYFLGFGMSISIIVALTRFVKEISLNFKKIKRAANKMGRDSISEQESYSKIIEFDDILRTLHAKGDNLKNLIDREKLEKQDLSFQIAALSHDIKTPLTVLKGNLELLELTVLSTSQQDYTLSMNNSISVLEGYFNSLISYTRMLSEERPAKLIIIEKLLNELHFEVNDLLNMNKVTYSLCNRLTSTSFYGDGSHLMRALSNLLVNAIRFTPVSNKKIEVTLSESSNQIYFEIWNNGQPFSENTLKNGNKLFYTEDYSRGSQHYGIGLAFVNGVATKHGGSLRLFNPARGGASAILSIKKNLQKL
ncbi:sensor histidine kinase [Streptococcus merionis]|uniref:histidine kinase n=1 Tax=Streptococcus merionis TaxID=400065 RepID=A0A239SNW1_9STRE|nr:HAMP domain-containing sensor histidine kinase [Streptococcus merionis]SNU86942.1 nisin biosynthesis sensor protein [Streptococcus merionis]